jgi:ubiquinone/menaquinone biosynthesis C-methylase UbiE
MDHFETIYQHRAQEYQHMIDVEDVDGNLLPGLERIIPLKGKRIIDLGTGTGRLPLLLKNMGVRLVGLDLNRPMLLEQKLQRGGIQGTWTLVRGDMRNLPFQDKWADVVMAGWAIGHLTGWYAADWQEQISLILQEMQRVAAPGGALIILETLTTGSLTPAPPSQGLADYYAWLEREWGFSREIISTDYQFASVKEAAESTEFFFGFEMAETIRREGWARLPEWTGIWGKRL